jgi:hypothetical protein
MLRNENRGLVGISMAAMDPMSSFCCGYHRNRYGRVCRCQRQKTVALGSFLIMSAFAVSGLIASRTGFGVFALKFSPER